jgi:hypothetical protein
MEGTVERQMRGLEWSVSTVRTRWRSGTQGRLQMVAGDREALRRHWSDDKGARQSRGVGKLRGEVVHRLSDGSHDR